MRERQARPKIMPRRRDERRAGPRKILKSSNFAPASASPLPPHARLAPPLQQQQQQPELPPPHTLRSPRAPRHRRDGHLKVAAVDAVVAVVLFPDDRGPPPDLGQADCQPDALRQPPPADERRSL